MAPPATPSAKSDSTSTVATSCSCGQTLAYLVLRVGLAMLLILIGVEKFKSPEQPYSYSFSNWHDKVNDAGEVVTYGKWLNVAKPVFEYGGFNNTAFYGETTVNIFSHIFKVYALVLPYAMLIVGFFILIGFLNRISLFLGAGIWLSLAMGQMTLVDNPTVQLTMNYMMYYVVALALVKYNRFGVTRY